MSLDSRLPAFRNLSPAARLDHIGQLLGLSHGDVSLLANAGALLCLGLIPAMEVHAPLRVAGPMTPSGKPG